MLFYVDNKFLISLKCYVLPCLKQPKSIEPTFPQDDIKVVKILNESAAAAENKASIFRI